MKIFYKDFQPFSVVEDKGFSELVKALNSLYKLPNRHSISKTLIPSLHQKCVQETKELLANELISACLTTDCWTSRSNDGYIAITIHFIDTTFKLRSVLLGCLNFEDHHTSHNLSIKIEETLINWNLRNKIIFAVSDNANNIKRALTLLQLRNFGCFAHTMNLIVQSALTSEKDLIEKVKNIVSRFRRSTNASQKLLTCQINSGIKDPKKLIQDICTRWNSTFYMLDRFVELEIYIRSTLGLIDNPPESLTSEEWTVVKELIQILQPFEEATKAVSGEKYMTASIIIIIAEGLQNVCSEMCWKKNFQCG